MLAYWNYWQVLDSSCWSPMSNPLGRKLWALDSCLKWNFSKWFKCRVMLDLIQFVLGEAFVCLFACLFCWVGWFHLFDFCISVQNILKLIYSGTRHLCGFFFPTILKITVNEKFHDLSTVIINLIAVSFIVIHS